MNTLKKIVKHPVFNLLLVLLIGYLVLSQVIEIDMNTLRKNIESAHGFYIFCAFISELISLIFSGIVLFKLSKLFTLKIRLKTSIESSFTQAMGAGVMPLGTGAQVFQYFILRKDEKDNTVIASTLWIEFLMYQFVLVLCALVSVVFNIDWILQSKFKIGILIGLLLTTSVFVLLLLMSLSKGFYKLVIKLLSFVLKPFKQKEQWLESTKIQVCKFRDSLWLMRENKKTILICTLLNLIRMIGYLSVSYWLAKAFNLSNVSLMTIMSFHMFIMLINSFLPIPGQSGSSEWLFFELFKGLYEPVTGTILLLWRFITYYFIMIVGFILFIANKLIDRREVNENRNI